MVGRMVNEAYRCLRTRGRECGRNRPGAHAGRLGAASRRAVPIRTDQGREAIVTLLEDLAVRYGERFRPSAALMSAGK